MSSIQQSSIEQPDLKLKLSQPNPFFLESLEWAAVPVPTPSTFDIISNIEDHNNNGRWDFMEKSSKKGNETPYIHPLVKRYSSKLSDKSLELCTENLGCETGSDIGEYSDVYSNSSSDSEDGKSLSRDRSSFRRNLSFNNNNKVIANLPPPLTSISDCVQVRPHREGGRLVIKTVLFPSSGSCFKAQRGNGRLRLCFVNHSDCDQAFEHEQQHQEVEEAIPNNEEKVEVENETESEVGEEEESEIEAEPEMEETEEVEEKETEDIFGQEDKDGNNIKDGSKMGIRKFQRPSRCKEGGRGNNGLLAWEPFWVAT